MHCVLLQDRPERRPSHGRGPSTPEEQAEEPGERGQLEEAGLGSAQLGFALSVRSCRHHILKSQI